MPGEVELLTHHPPPSWRPCKREFHVWTERTEKIVLILPLLHPTQYLDIASHLIALVCLGTCHVECERTVLRPTWIFRACHYATNRCLGVGRQWNADPFTVVLNQNWVFKHPIIVVDHVFLNIAKKLGFFKHQVNAYYYRSNISNLLQDHCALAPSSLSLLSHTNMQRCYWQIPSLKYKTYKNLFS